MGSALRGYRSDHAEGVKAQEQEREPAGHAAPA
jgi:hypothetical protein